MNRFAPFVIHCSVSRGNARLKAFISSELTSAKAAAIVSVKGGTNLHVNMVRELDGVIKQKKSPLGILITLREPTGPMVKEAATAEFLETPFGKFPRLQIVMVADLLDGKLPKLPPQEIGGGYKQAPKEQAEKQEKLI